MAADAGAGCVARGFGGRGVVLVAAARVTAWPCGSYNDIDGEAEATLRKHLAHIEDLSI